ncbi:MAG: hypothetical protein ACD_48C00502G0007 [uncultured bacterium]|nr:MAG: hypothetical protein ACD_48C00502G0007 [uncultured bacterium]
MIRFIVFHIRAVLAAGVSALLFESIVRFPNQWYLFGSLFLFTGVMILLIRRYVRVEMAVWDIIQLLLAYIATIVLVLFTEWRTVIILLEVLGALTIGTLIDMLLSNTDTTPIYIKKAFRRIRVMVWVFVAASLLISAYAVSFFFVQVPLVALFLFAGASTALCSYAIWRMYYQVPFGRFTIWLLIIAVMTMELFWVIHLLPFGYMVLGFLVTWLWYMLLLLIRFHISAEGIRWKPQRKFLIANAILFVLVLFVIRWI